MLRRSRCGLIFLLNTIRKERTYDVLSIQRESGNGTKITRKKRRLQIKINKKTRVVAIRAPAYTEGRLNEGPRLQLSLVHPRLLLL